MDFIPIPIVAIFPLDPEHIGKTFKELETLLTYTPRQIGDYFALKEAVYGICWINYYLSYIYDQPQHKEAKILDVLQNSINKPAANYLARIFFTYITIERDQLKQCYNGYQQLEQHLKMDNTLRISANGKFYKFL
jgi:hypothetical protein